MPRLNVVDPATATGKAKELFDGPLKGKHLNIFKGFANSPAVLQAYLGMAGALAEGTLTNQEREAVALYLGELNDCQYCLAAHTMLGKGAKLTPEEMIDIRKGKSSDPKRAALLGFVQTLYEKKGYADEQDLATFKTAGYDDGHIAEVIAAFALNTLTNYFNHVNDTEIDVPEAPPLD